MSGPFLPSKRRRVSRMATGLDITAYDSGLLVNFLIVTTFI
jgi:hypothetical protein